MSPFLLVFKERNGRMRSPIFSVEVNDLNHYLVLSTDEPGNKQDIYVFPNGYGASVILNSMSYGVELAVVRWEYQATNDQYIVRYDFEICYDTPITDDVVGNIQGGDELFSLLLRVKDLPSIKDE